MKVMVLIGYAMILSILPCNAQSTSAKQKGATRGTTSANATSPEIDPQKEADIRQLMQVTGAGGLGMQMMSNMETNIKPLMEHSLPPGAYRAKLIDLFFQKFQSEATQESLITLVIPVYDRHFSDEELRELIAFYTSPIGKKAITALPQVVSESQQAGSEWGKQLGQKCIQEVLTEHPELQQQLEQAEKAASSH